MVTLKLLKQMIELLTHIVLDKQNVCLTHSLLLTKDVPLTPPAISAWNTLAVVCHDNNARI